jgi:sugar phosphate isomerase/epimerase
MNRRNFLKTVGAGALSLAIYKDLLAVNMNAAKLPSFGLITGSGGQWHKDGPIEGLKKIAEWGYTELEGGGVRGMQADELQNLLKSLGLKRIIGSQGMANLIGDESKLKASIKGALDIGQEYIVCYWPWIGPAKGQKIDDWKEVADNLNKGGRICHSEGIQLIYHNHDFEFYPVEGQVPFDVLLPLLDPVVGIELDLYWIVKGGKSPVEYLKKYPGRYPVLHVKDMPSDVKCGIAPTNFELLTEKDFSPIGSGAIDFPEIFRTNEVSGAKHFIVEADKPGDTAEFLELSGKYLRNVEF